MKELFIESAKQVLKERRIIVTLVVFVVTCLVFLSYVAFNIQPSELKLVSHYSAYGSTNFYRDGWIYLLTFIGFGLTLLVGHTLLMLRILRAKGSELAYGFIWLSVIIVVIACAIAYQVLRIAALA